MNNFPETDRRTKDTKTYGVEGDEQRRIVAFARPPSPSGRRGPANPNPRPITFAAGAMRPVGTRNGICWLILLVVVVIAACIQEHDGAKLRFQHLTGACKKLRRLWVDGGYRRPTLRDWLTQHCRFSLTVVLRTDDQKRFVMPPRRWVVEWTFAWLNHHCRLSKIMNDYRSRAKL